MRKIKYAGIAAATLLAISPVATTAVGNSTQTVQAASTTGSLDFGDGLISTFKDFLSKTGLDKTTIGKTLISTVDKMAETAKKAQADSDANKVEAKDDSSKKAVEALQTIGKENIVFNDTKTGDLTGLINDNNKTVKSDKLAADLRLANAGTEQLGTIKADNKVLNYEITTGNTTQDVNTSYDSFKKLGNSSVPMSFTIKVTDPSNDDANLGSTTITFLNGKEVAAVSSSLYISFTTPIHVDAGDSTTDQRLTTSVDAKVTNEKGETVKPSSMEVGSFYNTEDDAFAQKDNEASVGASFAGDGLTYYQPVTLLFNDKGVDVASIFNNMIKNGSQMIKFNNDDEARRQNINNKYDNSITYVREIQVGSGFDNNTDKPGTDNNNNEDNNNDANLENGVWVEDNAAGKVTVGNSVASLYDDNNNLTNRAVAANSAWATDKSRVNSKTGLKQYHVSTHEWVNADDVTFSGDENNGSNALGTIANLSGHHTVDLDGPSGFVYALFSSNGKRSNRGLAGNTSWYTDKSATDGEGNTYYRVSTDEWIRVSSGVTFK